MVEEDASLGWIKLLFECSCSLPSWEEQWKVSALLPNISSNYY